MYRIKKIADNDGGGFTLTFIGENVERVNAVDYYREIQLAKSRGLISEILYHAKGRTFAMSMLKGFIEKRAQEDWNKLYNSIMAEKVPPFLFSALKTGNKKYQEKFLRGMKFTPGQLAAFYFTACTELGYTFSVYSSTHLPNGTDPNAMPIFANVEGDTVKISGTTSMKPYEIKQAVIQRSAIYGKILDKGDEWHCFFITIESAAGKENWKNGQPHYHYISDKFGIPREYVVKQLLSNDYNLYGLPHLELHGYR